MLDLNGFLRWLRTRRLCHAINFGGWWARDAIRELGEIGGTGAVNTLGCLLRDSRYCAMAAEALGTTGDARAVDMLVEVLGGYPRTSEYVSYQEYQKTILQSLRRLNWQPRDWHERIQLAKAENSFECLVTEGTAAIKPLVGILKESDSNAAKYAALALGAIGSREAVQPLIDAVGRNREAVATALGHLRDRRAVDVLIDMLKDPYSDTRRAAIRALGNIGDVRAVEPISRLLCDAYDGHIAVGVLGNMCSPQSVQLLQKHLNARFGVDGIRIEHGRRRGVFRHWPLAAIQALQCLLSAGATCDVKILKSLADQPDVKIKRKRVVGPSTFVASEFREGQAPSLRSTGAEVEYYFEKLSCARVRRLAKAQLRRCQQAQSE